MSWEIQESGNLFYTSVNESDVARIEINMKSPQEVEKVTFVGKRGKGSLEPPMLECRVKDWGIEVNGKLKLYLNGEDLRSKYGPLFQELATQVPRSAPCLEKICGRMYEKFDFLKDVERIFAESA